MSAERVMKPAPTVIDADLDTLRMLVVRDVEKGAARAIKERGFFALAVPGGSVAVEFFPALAASSVDWHAVEIFWVDERAVPPSDPASNFGAARSLLLDRAHAPERRIHRMPADAADPRAASAYADTIARVLGRAPRFDYVLLGVGADGHVASIFPGRASSGGALVVEIDDAPKPPPGRMTLTLPLLASARRVVVAGFGPEKARVLRRALDDLASELPVALVLRQAESAMVLMSTTFRP